MSTAPRFAAPLHLAYRQLGSQLLRAASDREETGPLRVLITGSESGVGASTLAEGVADMLAGARAGAVLLVGGCPPREQKEKRTDGVSVAGDLKRMPALQPFESTEELGRDLERLGEGHRFLLLDSEPIIADSDTQLVADLCDVAWLVVATGRSRWPNARTAAEMLRSTRAGSTGVVLNRKGRGLPGWLRRLTDRAHSR